MTKTIFVAALLAAFTVAAPAQAQSGLRADVHVGGDRISVHQRTDVGIDGATIRTRDTGLIYGGEIGYDLAVKALSLGVYGGVAGATAKQCAEVYAEVEPCTKWGRNFTMGARAGVKVTDRVLLYGKGGYSNGQMKGELIDHVTPANSVRASQTMDGYHFGGGVQIGLFSNLHAKVEYVHTDYQDYDEHEGTATISRGVDRDNVVVGFGIRF